MVLFLSPINGKSIVSTLLRKNINKYHKNTSTYLDKVLFVENSKEQAPTDVAIIVVKSGKRSRETVKQKQIEKDVNSYSTEKLRMIAEYMMLPRDINVTTGCLPKSNICTNCLVADQVIATSISSFKEMIEYYSVTFPNMVAKIRLFEASLSNRSFAGGNIYQKYYGFPITFFTELFPLIENDTTVITKDVFSIVPEEYEYSSIYLTAKAINYIFPKLFSFVKYTTNLVDPSKESFTLANTMFGNLAKRIFTCDVSALYSCSSKKMEFGEGVILTSIIYSCLFVLSLVAPITRYLFTASLVFIPWIFAFITYDTSPMCVLLPSCVLDDLLEFLRDGIFTPCLRWGGLMVPSTFFVNGTYYNTDYPETDTCPSCSSSSSMLNCASDIGFTDPVHNILFVIKWISPSFYSKIPNAPWPLGVIVNGDLFRKYYDAFIMIPGKSRSKRSNIKNYLESKFSIDGENIPTPYKTCFFVSIFNFATVPLLIQIALLALKITRVLISALVSLGLCFMSLLSILCTMLLHIRVFVDNNSWNDNSEKEEIVNEIGGHKTKENSTISKKIEKRKMHTSKEIKTTNNKQMKSKAYDISSTYTEPTNSYDSLYPLPFFNRVDANQKQD